MSAPHHPSRVARRPYDGHQKLRPVLHVAVILTIIVGIGILASPPVAEAYSCSGSHCYGRNTWQAGAFNSWHGAATGISVVHLYCNGCSSGGTQTGFVDNEMWFADDWCSDPYGSPCWIEAGYSTYSGGGITTENYFWADDRRDYGYIEHALAAVPSGDYGSNVYIQIHQCCNSSQTWDVSLSSTTYYSDNTSVNNPMTPGDVKMGQELAGNGGASSFTAYFTGNEYEDTNNNWHWFNWDGSLQYYNPPYAGYNVRPSQSSSGGSIYTYCC